MKTVEEKFLDAVQEGAEQLVQNKREDLLRAFETGLTEREPKLPPEPPKVTVNNHLDVAELTDAVWKLAKVGALMLNQAQEAKPPVNEFRPTINNPKSVVNVDLAPISGLLADVKALLSALLAKMNKPRKMKITNDDGTITTVEG